MFLIQMITPLITLLIKNATIDKLVSPVTNTSFRYVVVEIRSNERKKGRDDQISSNSIMKHTLQEVTQNNITPMITNTCPYAVKL